MLRLFPILPLAVLTGCMPKGPVPSASSADTVAIEALVNQHFAAIQAADRATLETLWAAEGATVSHAEDGAVTSAPVATSIAIWTQQPEPAATWEIEDISVLGGEVSTVSARFRWNEADYAEHLTLLKDSAGWRLVSKTYTVTSAAPVNTQSMY